MTSNELSQWSVYIVTCSDGTLYTGITTDISRRINEHNNSPRGAKYTRSRRPVMLLASRQVSNRSAALRCEWFVKQQSKSNKVTTLLSWCEQQ